jgi:hypothetical protein
VAVCSIPLGTEARVALLYSYPNTPDAGGSLADTVTHWFTQTLVRDGVAAAGATASVRVEAGQYYLDLDGPPDAAASFPTYAERLPRFLQNGHDALTTVIPQLQSEGRWDPSPDPEPPPYRPWRFFLPHGLAMVHQRSLQFFHYPPIRLLEGTRDYLMDPVPVRWAELLEANGVGSEQEAWLYETVMDATPIAAEDDQGSKPGGDPHWGLIPIQAFHAYQRAQVELLLNVSPARKGYTVPIVVYGAHPRDTFSALFGVKLGVNVAATAEILPGRKTPVLGSNHPYVFYATAQGFATVGSGRVLSEQDCRAAAKVMTTDLVVARWQKLMADDPSQDPQTVLVDCTAYWTDPSRARTVCALTRHQASLHYPDPTSLAFRFDLSLADAAAACGQEGNDPCAGVTPGAAS